MISSGGAFPSGVNVGELFFNTVTGVYYRYLGGGVSSDPLNWVIFGGTLVNDPDTTGWTVRQDGATWFNKAENVIKYWDGSQIIIVGSGSSGILGIVTMYRTGDGVWAVVDEQGNAIDISASTTDGLQEAINRAGISGSFLWVLGGGITDTGVDVSVIQCTTGIVWPSMQGKTIRIDWCTINFSVAVTGIGMFFDSCMMVDFHSSGQIVYSGNNSAVVFVPTNNVPFDAVKGILDSQFRFGPVVTVAGTNPKGVSWDATAGPVLGNIFEFQEVNGANGATVFGQHGLVIGSAASSDGIIGNIFRCPHLHKWSGSSIQIGTDTVAAVDVHSNMFDLVIYPDGVASIGVQVYGIQNSIKCAILNNEGTVHTGIKLETSADRNIFEVLRNNAATTLINDASTTKSNIGLGGGRMYYVLVCIEMQ